MKSLPKFYQDYIDKNFGSYHATWLPTRELNVGDVISIGDDGGIIPQSTLNRLEIPFEVVQDETPFDTDSKQDADVDIAPVAQAGTPAVGNVVTNAEVGFNIHFKKGNSVVFKLSGSRLYRINFIAELTPTIIKKFKEGTWQKEWMIITELIKADSGTIILAQSGNTSISLKAKADVHAGPIKITDPSLSFDNSANNDDTGTYIKSDITPLYRCMGIKSSLFGIRFNTRGIIPESEMDSLTVGEITPEEMEDDTTVIDESDL